MMFQRLRNLWKLGAYNFDQATKGHLSFVDGTGNKIELQKSHHIKKKPATIIYEQQLEESIIDEGGKIE